MFSKSPYLRVSYVETNRVLDEPYQRIIVGIVLLALLCAPLLRSDYLLHLLNLTLLATIGAVGLNLLTGYCGQVSLGHAGFIAIGGFTTAVLAQSHGLPFWVAVPASCLAGAVVGFVVGLPALRFRGIYLAITTLAMHYAIIFLLTTYQANFGASATAGISIPSPVIGGFELNGERSWYFVLLAVTVVVVVFNINLSRTYIGRAWVAIRDRDIAAAACGIDVTWSKLLAFMTSAALAALTGSLSAYFTAVVTVEAYTLELAILYLAMIIVGGMGSVAGSVLGAVFMTLLPFGIERVFDELPRAWRLGTTAFGIQEAAVGIAIIGFLLFEPKGLIEIYRRIATYFERWPFRYRELQPAERR